MAHTVHVVRGLPRLTTGSDRERGGIRTTEILLYRLVYVLWGTRRCAIMLRSLSRQSRGRTLKMVTGQSVH